MQVDAQTDLKTAFFRNVAQECPAMNRRLLANFFDAQTPLQNYAMM
ncbi:hypothetical protein [Caballeronia novacaledonica]|uniref:Uncharacterized protein n=1 Tax=Caballeronia novacaledonica TaxID=1544861 RepID=A0AA37IKG7_9BURK|nr:hypothetical protein [Caballeronia novacaledonica]GJH30378.1 hypothetical protein CBA19CS42_37700 [Caballeronia novacaledonica]